MNKETKQKICIFTFFLELELGRGTKTEEENINLFKKAAENYAILGADE